MEIYNRIIQIIDANIILCLVPFLFTIILIEIIFKNRFKTKQVLNLVRWMIITYSIFSLMFFLIGIVISPDKLIFVNRATGPYAITYWLMFLCAAVLPFSLFYKKLGLNSFYLVLIVFLMKIGFYFERFVILVTSLHRDYATTNHIFDFSKSLIESFLHTLLQGFILAILSLVFFEMIAKTKTPHNSR